MHPDEDYAYEMRRQRQLDEEVVVRMMFKPMLACSESCHHFFDQLKFPLLASAKIDGIRATVRDGVVYARSNQPFPNAKLQAKFKHLDYVDGEFVLGSPTRHDLCRATGGVTNSKDKDVDDLQLYMFDHVLKLNDSFIDRRNRLFFDALRMSGAIIHEQRTVATLDDLLAYEQECLDAGYEGLIVRSPNAAYKNGRSTAKEQALLKLKRFTDAEATIVNYFEREHNGNEATVSALGRTKRSSAKAGKTGRGDLGGFVLRTSDGIEFSCGTGFSDGERLEYWGKRDELVGKIVKFKYFSIGVKTAPRHPVWLGFRDPIDM